jgi:hypothetical protein
MESGPSNLRRNLGLPDYVTGSIGLRSRPGGTEGFMAFWEKLFSRKAEPKQRVRVCIECGMPIAEHKDWCSILRTQQEMDRKAAAASRAAAQES